MSKPFGGYPVNLYDSKSIVTMVIIYWIIKQCAVLLMRTIIKTQIYIIYLSIDPRINVLNTDLTLR